MQNYFCHPACQAEAGEGWRNSSGFSNEVFHFKRQYKADLYL